MRLACFCLPWIALTACRGGVGGWGWVGGAAACSEVWGFLCKTHFPTSPNDPPPPHTWDVDVVEQVAVEFDRLAGGEEDHHLRQTGCVGGGVRSG